MMNGIVERVPWVQSAIHAQQKESVGGPFNEDGRAFCNIHKDILPDLFTGQSLANRVLSEYKRRV